jgi:hypothetical protein
LALRLASNSPLAIPLQQFFSLQQSSLQFVFPLQQSSSTTFPSVIHFPFSIPFPFGNPFPSAILFPSKSLPHQKAKSQKPQAKAPKAKAKASFSESFIFSGKQSGAAVLQERRDIVTGETCIPSSLNINNLGEEAVLYFPLL